MIKFSIITINLNNFEGLKKTFNSVIQQTYKNYEFVIIDGGSTDGSKEYIINNSFYVNFWLSEPDNGIYDAMNKGINQAAGDYLLFLNSGDYFYSKETLKNVYQKINSNIISSNFLFFGDIINCHNKIVNQKFKVDKIFFIRNMIDHQSVFFPINIFKQKIYDQNYKIKADYELFVWSIFKGYKFIYIDEIICYKQPQGISDIEENYKKYSIPEKLRIFKKYYCGKNVPFLKKIFYKARLNAKYLFITNRISSIPFLYKYLSS